MLTELVRLLIALPGAIYLVRLRNKYRRAKANPDTNPARLRNLVWQVRCLIGALVGLAGAILAHVLNLSAGVVGLMVALALAAGTAIAGLIVGSPD